MNLSMIGILKYGASGTGTSVWSNGATLDVVMTGTVAFDAFSATATDPTGFPGGAGTWVLAGGSLGEPATCRAFHSSNDSRMSSSVFSSGESGRRQHTGGSGSFLTWLVMSWKGSYAEVGSARAGRVNTRAKRETGSAWNERMGVGVDVLCRPQAAAVVDTVKDGAGGSE